jgi:glycosyltransferase involved in cell wall biosynthesis
MLADCQAFAQQTGLGSRCKFFGDCQCVPELLAQAHVAVLSSRSETLSLAVIEAMRAGLPVVASNAGGMQELVQNGVTGYLFNPGDQDALHATLARLTCNPEQRGNMGRAGRALYEAEFQASIMLSKTLAVYKSVLT